VVEPFRVLCADAPWLFNDKLPGKTRGAQRNYNGLTRRELMRFPLPNLAADCVLFFWRVAAMQRDALDVIDAWGFDPPQREIVWLKKTVNGNRFFGMGHVVRAEHEICLIAMQGHPVVKNHSVRSTFVTDFEGLSNPVGRHSQKPERFYDIIETLYDGPYCELFARRQRPGWTCVGDEVPA
jgi:N6-adenosine-specific RNA methylase IME4